jgi:superfamily I DNA/RNA helicase
VSGRDERVVGSDRRDGPRPDHAPPRLDARQRAVVDRDYPGPAKIGGPAGTGKTAVALHRLARLARREDGPLLFTTLARGLPHAARTSFAGLAPEHAARVEFTDLHAWAREFLAERGTPLRVNAGLVDEAFVAAWSQAGTRGPIAAVEPNPSYWRTEIDRVIKGRGVRDLDEYTRITRAGRRVRLDRAQREQVWQLYRAYQAALADAGLADHNDLLVAATRELRRQPPASRYAAVVVDEVQDVPLVGLHLAAELAGHGPNALLLVGDGQQQVYPGGWRLSDAGIPVGGRSELLRVNYRNAARVLDLSSRMDAANQVDDIDGAATLGLREVGWLREGGSVHTWRGIDDELPEALVSALRELPVPRGEAAVIAFTRAEAERYARTLRRAGIDVQWLADFDGQPSPLLKIGTVAQAKGLEFRAALVPRPPQWEPGDSGASREHIELVERQRLVAVTRARDHLWFGLVDSHVEP